MFFKGSNAKFYSVFLNPKAYEVSESAIFVKEGFSFWAAIPYFTPFWFFQRKMWLEAVIALLALLTIFSLAMNEVVSINMVNVLLLGYALFAGFTAIDLYSNSLFRQSYVLSSIVTGRDLLEAQQRFFNSYLSRNNRINNKPELDLYPNIS